MFFAKPYTKVIRLLYEHRAQLWVGILVMASMACGHRKTILSSSAGTNPFSLCIMFIARLTSAHEYNSCNHLALAGDSMHKMYFSWKT